MNHAYFSKVEAEEKIGKRIVTQVAWPLVPAWTQGTVTRTILAYTWQGTDTYHAVLIRWDLPSGLLLEDGFSKLDYQRFLAEVEVTPRE